MGTDDTNAWVSFGALDDPPSAAGMCLLVPAWVDSAGGPAQVRRGRTGLKLQSVPDSGWFSREYAAGVLLFTDSEDLAETGDISGELAEDVGLAAKLSREMDGLLGCVDSGLYRVKSDKSWSRAQDLLVDPLEYEHPRPDRLDFAFVVGHGDAAAGQVGGMEARDVDELLSAVGVKEAVFLVCGGGCPNVGQVVSSDRIAVACGASVDARAAFIFGVNYIWKRFGEGASSAQALGASNVVLPQ